MVKGVEGITSDLGDSNVTPIPVRELRPEPFTQTKSEWAADNRERVIRTTLASATPTIIFTVPDNKTLYIIYAWITASNNAGVRDMIRMGIDSATNENTFLQLAIGLRVGAATNDTNNSISASFLMPIKVRSGETIVLDRDQGAVARGGFVGYLE